MRTNQRSSATLANVLGLLGMLLLSSTAGLVAAQEADSQRTKHLTPKVIEQASGAEATKSGDGVVRIEWSRDDVPVEVDGMKFPPAAGLGSWAAFRATSDGKAMVMGDTVVFQDEVNPAIDAALAHGLEVTALHNHFFYDEPKVYFMHIGGHGEPAQLAGGVKAVWDAIKQVRDENAEPAARFGGQIPQPGEGSIDAEPVERITGLGATINPGGVVKVTVGREAQMHDEAFGAPMGLTTWAAFSGSDELAAMDGDFAMRAEEVTSVIRALRRADIHVVALHNHMIGETPSYYFLHFWGVRPAEKLAEGFRAALDAQGRPQTSSEASTRWTFDDMEPGTSPPGWKTEGTNQSGPVATWAVETDADAPSQPNVLVLTDPKQGTRGTFNLLWTDHERFKDGAVEVKVRARSGRIDQGGGPIWRVQDKDNYYIARWNPLEDNFRLYYVNDGRRVQLASADVTADPAGWHTIRIEHEGDEIEGYLDGQELLKVRDETFTGAGGVGLWTKADAATGFDDFRISNAPAEPQ